MHRPKVVLSLNLEHAGGESGETQPSGVGAHLVCDRSVSAAPLPNPVAGKLRPYPRLALRS